MKSIVSYPDRGSYGNAHWRGNCSGRLVKDLLNFFKPVFVLDPMEGSGTTRQVCAEMKIKYCGFDLHNGFNILKNRLAEIMEENPDFSFLHPPYHNIIYYSGNVWGSAPHPDDLSRCTSYEEFIDKLQIAFYNVYEVLKSKGHYAVLVGDIRKNGKFTSIQADVAKMAPGSLKSIVIKEQHNCVSDRISYAGRFIPITHEYLLIFQKSTMMVGFLDTAYKTSIDMVNLSNASWKAVLYWCMKKLGGRANLQSIYTAVEENAQEKIKNKENWKSKIRQQLQLHFSNCERGVWEFREAV